MAENPHLRHLDPKVKLVWFIPPAAILLFLWLAVFLALFLFGVESPISGVSRQFFAAGLFFFMLLFIAAPVYAYNHVEYMSFTYELAPKEFILRQGVFTRETTVIPYARIQNINTSRTMLERLMGLATLGIDTAGTNPNAAEGLLPGVARKDELIREIMDRVEAAKSHQGHMADGLGHTGAPVSADGLPSERQLLSDILKELVQLKHMLHQSASHARPPSPTNPPENLARRVPPPTQPKT